MTESQTAKTRFLIAWLISIFTPLYFQLLHSFQVLMATVVEK